MNIKEAKEQIKNAMTAYFTKDERGDYVIALHKQRPIFLMGPPGIGKTAVMQQVAAEMGVGLLSYSMTHHTRQSALGLPFIAHKKYGGVEYDISEYTMSEIISAIYEMMENTGIKEGILFLDEINCVSETLAPVMLQFLQYKVFGRHRVPEGWIVVTAGNPPEYNNSVREFDIVTWDRLKRVDVEPNYEVWKEYAYKVGVHASITTFLDIKKNSFYKVESTVDGKSFVTARGWEDLSIMIDLYEKNNINVDIKLIQQYLQNEKIAKNFATYYDLFNKYKSDYQVESIIDGKEPDAIRSRAAAANMGEKLALVGLLNDAVSDKAYSVVYKGELLKKLMSELKTYKKYKNSDNHSEVFMNIISKVKKELKSGKDSGSLSEYDISVFKGVLDVLDADKKIVIAENDGNKAFEAVRADFRERVAGLEKAVTKTKGNIANALKFCGEVFGSKGQEVLILTTEFTANPYISGFIGNYGCEEYFKCSEALRLSERANQIEMAIEKLELSLV